MLVKLCLEEDVPLVNVVRRPEQAELLRSIGAVHVCDSSAPSFKRDLRDAVAATSATLAFDATGGGSLASQILTAMEAAASQSATEYSRYGSTVRKQVYIYGGLDPSPTILTRTFGFAWNVGGWLLTPFLQSIGPERFAQLRQTVAAGIDDHIRQQLLERDLTRPDPRSQRVLPMHQAVHGSKGARQSSAHCCGDLIACRWGRILTAWSILVNVVKLDRALRLQLPLLPLPMAGLPAVLTGTFANQSPSRKQGCSKVDLGHGGESSAHRTTDLGRNRVLSKRQFVESRHATNRDEGDLRNGGRPVDRSERHRDLRLHRMRRAPGLGQGFRERHEKQQACAAAINSSELDPGSSSDRDFNVKRPRPPSPAVNVPTPAGTSPLQVAVAFAGI